MKHRIATLAIATAGMVAHPAIAQDATAMSEEQFVQTVDDCLEANSKTEFDTPQDVLARVVSSCEFTTTIRIPARDNPILGDLLQFDANKGAFVWNAKLDENNRFYGGGLSPYSLAVSLDANGRMVQPNLPEGVEPILKEVGNANFFMLPLFRTAEDLGTYTASNAFGASREVLRTRETRYGIAVHVPPKLSSLLILEMPMASEKARDIADHLDIAITFTSGEVCKICYKSTTIERGQRPTINSPIDKDVTTHVTFGNITRFDVIDRRNGELVYAAAPQ